jgi:hypothetical protein
VANPLLLDSVDGCVITGNIDTGSPPNGSWNTKGTFGAGSYIFDNNRWHTTTPSLFHAASFYRFGNEIGLVGRNRGRTAAPSATNVLTISHGCLTTPKVVQATPEGNVGNFYVLSIGASTFQVAWGIAGTPSWHWQAEI